MAGGYRPGSGAKKNQHRIATGELRRAIEAELGIPYHEMLAQTQKKLFLDFQQDKNVRDFIRFTENMSNRILINQETEVNITASDLSTEEIENRIANLSTRLALSQKAKETSTNDQEDPQA